MYQISIFEDLSQGQVMNQTLRSFIIGLICVYTIFDFILLNNSYLCHFFSGMKYIIIGTEEVKKNLDRESRDYLPFSEAFSDQKKNDINLNL